MKNSLVIQISIFITFVICGFWVGSNYLVMLSEFKESSNTTTINQALNSKDQNNILIVTISKQADATYDLTTILSVTYFMDNPSITFTTIFPKNSAGELIHDSAIYESFQLISINGKTLLSGDFLSELKNQNIEWDTYLVFDHKIIMDLIDKATTQQQRLQFNDGVTDIHNNAISPNFQQVSLAIQAICSQIEKQEFVAFKELFDGSNSGYIISNKSPELISYDMDTLLTRPQSPICILPLNTLSPHGDS